LKRTCSMVIRFTKGELEELTKKARKTHYSREGFCRAVLNGATIKEAPNAEVDRLIMEMRRVGANLNQVLKNMNASGFLDMPKFRQNMDDLRSATKLIVDTYSNDET